jgi:hypothetical protein
MQARILGNSRSKASPVASILVELTTSASTSAPLTRRIVLALIDR